MPRATFFIYGSAHTCSWLGGWPVGPPGGDTRYIGEEMRRESRGSSHEKAPPEAGAWRADRRAVLVPPGSTARVMHD